MRLFVPGTRVWWQSSIVFPNQRTNAAQRAAPRLLQWGRRPTQTATGRRVSRGGAHDAASPTPSVPLIVFNMRFEEFEGNRRPRRRRRPSCVASAKSTMQTGRPRARHRSFSLRSFLTARKEALDDASEVLGAAGKTAAASAVTATEAITEAVSTVEIVAQRAAGSVEMVTRKMKKAASKRERRRLHLASILTHPPECAWVMPADCHYASFLSHYKASGRASTTHCAPVLSSRLRSITRSRPAWRRATCAT